MANSRRRTLGVNVVPENYSITIEPDLKTFVFKGRETIKVKIKKPTKKIKINSKELKVAAASVSDAKGAHAAMLTYNKKDETVELSLSSAVSGSARISLEFEGENNYSAHGFYKSKYKFKGKEECVLTTQFEPVYAREAFPCFDEPALKATFDLSLLIDPALTSISNMPKASETKQGKKKLVVFDRSPRMSTYLLYIGVGKFVSVAKKFNSKTTFDIVTVPGRSGLTDLPMADAKRFMTFHESYFKIPYPLPKMDFIAIPDFQGNVSAMENWGAITSRETTLIGDEKKIAVPIRRRIAVIIAHELAHQWFGDLVTMAWWDDLWLNESFATFMESKAIDAVFPEWKFGVQQVTARTASGLADDQLRSTHPINVQVNEPSEVGEIFDAISYSKGGSVIAMIEDYVGEENLQKGLHAYLKKHAYSNATKEDLWNAIGKAGGKESKNLPRVASFWINEPGFPIVHAEGPKDGIVTLRQERFTILPMKRGGSKAWPIPIRYITEKSDGMILMDKRTATIDVGSAKMVKLNAGQRGFYRVSYGKENLQMLGRQIREGKIREIDAWGVVNDLFALSKACKIKVFDVLDFIEDYCMDCDYPLNNSISSYLSGLIVRFTNNKRIMERAKRMSIRFDWKILHSLGWEKIEGEDGIDTMNRIMVIRNLGVNGDREVVKKANAIFDDYVNRGVQIDTDMKLAVYKIVAANGDQSTLKRFIEMYKKQDTGEEIIKLSIGLGGFNDPVLIKEAFGFAMSKYVRPQDKDLIPSYGSSNPAGKKLILEWTEKNWKALRKIFEGDVMGIGNFIDNLCVLDRREDKAEIARFFKAKENYIKDVNRALKNAIEFVETNIRFVEYNSE